VDQAFHAVEILRLEETVGNLLLSKETPAPLDRRRGLNAVAVSDKLERTLSFKRHETDGEGVDREPTDLFNARDL